MIKLKGGDADDKNSILAQTAKRMNLPMLNGKGSKANSSFTSPGSHHAAQQQSASSSAIPDGPTPLAARLGMPSASAAAMMGGDRAKKDWSASSNRIALGAPVFIKGRSWRDDEEEAEVVDDRPKRRIGDATLHSEDEEEEEDEDALAAAAGGGDADEQRLLAAMREQRLAELKATSSKQQGWLALGHGSYSDIAQDEFLKAVTTSKYVVCHFYHAEFERCRIVDHHLGLLAAAHLPTRFIRVNADKAPFFVGKLQVKVLPTVVCFKDGIAIDRIVGFEELGGVDDFPTAAIEKRLAKAGMLLAKDDKDDGSRRRDGAKGSIRQGQQGQHGQDEGSDNDD
jgi:hypothetical protein